MSVSTSPPSSREHAPGSDRAQTDESLRIERATSDGLAEPLDRIALIEEAADAVLATTRARADAVLARARAEADRLTAPGDAVAEERGIDDAVVASERAEADAVVHVERVAMAAALVAERRRTDDDLRSERVHFDQALDANDHAMAVVSHEIGNIVQTISGLATLIAMTASDPTRATEVALHAQRIQRAGTRMIGLTRDLTDLGSARDGALPVSRERVDPSHVVMEVVEAMQPQATALQLALVPDLAAPRSRVSLDPARILQVLTNLISNAMKFTPAGGAIVVRMEQAENELWLRVQDTGIGIPPDKLEVVFERFVQIQEGDSRGRGLGLSISRHIVRGHGGRIWAESELGKGTTVTVALPI